MWIHHSCIVNKATVRLNKPSNMTNTKYLTKNQHSNKQYKPLAGDSTVRKVIFQLREVCKSNSHPHTLCPSEHRSDRTWRPWLAGAAEWSSGLHRRSGFSFEFKTRGWEWRKVKKIDGFMAQAATCRSGMRFLQTSQAKLWDTWPGDARRPWYPQPLWRAVDFREGSSVHRSFSARSLPSDWSQSGTCQFAEHKPQRFSGFWDSQLWNNYPEQLKNKQTNKNPKTLTP